MECSHTNTIYKQALTICTNCGLVIDRNKPINDINSFFRTNYRTQKKYLLREDLIDQLGIQDIHLLVQLEDIYCKIQKDRNYKARMKRVLIDTCFALYTQSFLQA